MEEETRRASLIGSGKKEGKMEALLFFVGVPLTAGLVQFFLCRSRAARLVKWCPTLALCLVLLVCFLGVIDWLPLPKTYWMDRRSFLAFPDYFCVGLFCLPALFGVGMGALFAVGDKREME